MKRKAFKKILAVVLVGAMAAGLTVTASAADGYYDAPTSPMEVNPTYATASVHRAASVLPEILGLSTSSGFQTLKNGEDVYTLDEAQTSLMLGAFGTDMNINPDPYYYNLFYNYYAAEHGLEPSQDAMLQNLGASGGPARADTTIIDGYGTSISLASRPDMLIGVSGSSDLNGYDALIADIRTGAIGEEYYQDGDEDYAPYLVNYTTSTTYDMLVSFAAVAYIMDNCLAPEGKYGRYSSEYLGADGKTATEIAEDYSDYALGITTFVQSKIASGEVTKKDAVVVNAVDEDTLTFELATADPSTGTAPNNRIAEYIQLVTNNLANEQGENFTVPQLMEADAIVLFPPSDDGAPAMWASLVDTIEKYDADNGTDYYDQLDDKVSIQAFPESVYGITMNSIENVNGFGFYVGFLYCDEIPEISPQNMTAYYYQNFYHINDIDDVQSVLNTTFGRVTMPKAAPSTELSNYNPEEIEADLQAGKDYYYANFDEYAETALAKVWTEDQSGPNFDGFWKQYDAADDVLSLETVVSEANGLNEDDYTADSWAALKEAVADAQTVLDDQSRTTAQISAAVEEVKTAIDNLVEAADKTALADAIAEAEALNEDDYTSSSWAALEVALKDAQAVMDDANATQDDVDDAVGAIEDAIDGLVARATPEEKGDLQDEIDAAETLNEDDYTADSWRALQDAIIDAQEAVDYDDATSQEIKDASAALEDALENLVEKASEEQKEELQNEIDEAEAVNPDDYTQDSYDALQDAVDNAKDVLDNDDASAEEVEAAIEDVKTAMDNLEPVTPTPTPDYNGVVKVDGVWGYYVDGVLQTSYTGVSPVSNENGWWYIKNGLVDFSANTVAKNQNGWYYVLNGKVRFDFTGLANYKNENGWWYISGGKVDFSHNGVDKNNNGWYYVEGGKVRFDFTGLSNYKNANGWWYISGGKVNFSHNGVDKNKNGWYYVTGGKVQFGFTGLAHYKNANGWWYIKNGKVDFTYNGRATNQNGTYNVRNGKVVF